MIYCLDSNILLRWVDIGTTDSTMARKAVELISRRGDSVVITPQNLVEFWAVATRPRAVNGLGMSSQQANSEMISLQTFFPLIPDTAAIHDEWCRIVVQHNVSGTRTHDARLAAALRVHGVSHILTFNVSDFKSFENPIVVHPSELS